MTTDNYDPAGSLSAYYPSRAGRLLARIWAREKTLHDWADFGAVQFFEGGGSDPTVLTGYATNKLWLRVDEGVTDEAATVRYYAGGTASSLASWPELDREGFAAHLGARSAGELDLVWSTDTSGDPGTGKVRGNHATLASITSLAISKTGRQGQSYGARIALMDDDDIIRVYGVGADGSYVDVRLTGAPSDQTTYYTVSCVVRAATNLANGQIAGLSHHPTATAIDTAQDWAEKIDGSVDGSSGFSSKAWAIGGTGVTDTAARGAAKDWATKAEDSTVDGSGYSALHHAAKASAQRVLAETARDLSEDYRDAAETARDLSEGYRDAALTAKAAAELAEASAVSAQSGAESARDAAFANANVYADVATGRAAVADGAQFMVVSDDEIIRYRRDSSSTQTEMARYPTADVVGTSYTIGWDSPVATGTATAANYTVVMQTEFTADTYVTQVTLGATAAGVGKILVVTMSGNAVASLVQSVDVDIAAGVNVIPCNILVEAGQRIGFQNVRLYNAASGNPAVWLYSGAVSVGTTMTSSTQWRYELEFLASDGHTGQLADHDYRIEAVEAIADTVGTSQAIGWPTIVATGTNVPANYSVILQEPVAQDGYLTELVVGSTGAGTAHIYVVTMSGTTVTVVSDTTATLTAGVNTLRLAIPVAAGQYVGVGNNYKFQSSSNPLAVPVWYKSGLISSGNTLTSSTQHRYEVAFTVSSGHEARLELLEVGTGTGDGMALLADADNTGVADATAAFATAWSSHPHPYVRPGIFAVTALAAFAGGFWGPGAVKLNGTRLFLPTTPAQIDLYNGLRAGLMPEIASGAPLVVIGDSISHWAYATTGGNHFLNLLTAFANAWGSPADQPIMTALRPSATYDPSFYGVTTSGSVSTGTNGPLGESIVLAAGASLSFTGAYEQVDVFYTQQAGAGSLAFAYNGGASYKTVTCAGATDLDHYSGPSATGQTASGTYSITASGGSVEITGLLRLGVKTANTPPRLLTHRAAHGSYQFTNFGSAAVTSILKQCSALSATPPYVVIALGTNDRAALTTSDYAAMKSRAQTLVDALQAGGVTRIAAIMPMRPGGSSWDSYYAGKLTFDQLIGALTEVYAAEGVRVIPTHKFDAYGAGLFSEGLHPNDAGNVKIAQMMVEELGR